VNTIKLILLIFILITSSAGMAQDEKTKHKIDSLSALLNKKLEIKKQIEVLNDLSFEIRNINTDTSLAFAERALHLSIE